MTAIYVIFIILFGIKQLNKLWKTIHQLSCFVGHPVQYIYMVSYIILDR